MSSGASGIAGAHDWGSHVFSREQSVAESAGEHESPSPLPLGIMCGQQREIKGVREREVTVRGNTSSWLRYENGVRGISIRATAGWKKGARASTVGERPSVRSESDPPMARSRYYPESCSRIVPISPYVVFLVGLAQQWTWRGWRQGVAAAVTTVCTTVSTRVFTLPRGQGVFAGPCSAHEGNSRGELSSDFGEATLG